MEGCRLIPVEIVLTEINIDSLLHANSSILNLLEYSHNIDILPSVLPYSIYIERAATLNVLTYLKCVLIFYLSDNYFNITCFV